MRQVLPDDLVRRVRFVGGDVTDLDRLRAALAEHAVTHVVHLAGLQVPVCRADPLLGARVNVLGTLAVFEAVRRSEGKVERLVYASSAAVFGAPEDYAPGPVADDVLLRPMTHYGCFKWCNEGNARVYFQDHGLASVGLRPSTVYGPGRDFGLTSEPTKAVKALALGRPYHVSYGGLQNLQFAEDVAGVFVRCLEVPHRGAAAYNLRGEVVDMADFHRALCAADPAASHLITHGDRPLHIACDLDDDALRRDLGAVPHTPLAEGVRRTLEQFRRLQAEGRLETADLGG
jgi:nucleoside-diphosphate-sugar epimerase